LVIKTLDLDPDPLEMLDPEPYLDSMTDPQHWCSLSLTGSGPPELDYQLCAKSYKQRFRTDSTLNSPAPRVTEIISCEKKKAMTFPFCKIV
jgi:hypothetical protein